MPEPDGQIQSRNLADGAVTSRVFDTNIQSDNYVTGSAGWQIRRDTGDVEFNNAVFRGHLIATSGAIGNLDIDGTLTMVTGGVIQTGATGSARVEISTANTNNIFMYSGVSAETVAPLMWSGEAAIPQPTTFLALSSGRVTGTAGDDSQIKLYARNSSANAGYIDLSSESVRVSIGTTSGTEMMRIDGTRADFDIGTLSFVQLPVKTTAGDPSSPLDGDFYVNTSDNTLRLRADGAWRTVASW